MQTLKLLQIGDVHYPDLLRDFPTADLKDPGYPRAVLARSVPASTLARSWPGASARPPKMLASRRSSSVAT